MYFGSKIYIEIEKLYDMLVEYLDGYYLDAEMIDNKLVWEVIFKVLTNKELSRKRIINNWLLFYMFADFGKSMI